MDDQPTSRDSEEDAAAIGENLQKLAPSGSACFRPT